MNMRQTLRGAAYAVWADALDFARAHCPGRVPEVYLRLDAALAAIEAWVEAVGHGVEPEVADALLSADAIAGLGFTTPSRLLAAA
jgi:hypothetical protein